jgi:hypothetical protein
MEFAQHVFINDPYVIPAQIIMFLIACLMLQMSNLDFYYGKKNERKRKTVDTNAMLFVLNQRRAKTDIVFSVYRPVFSFFLWQYDDTHIYIYIYI